MLNCRGGACALYGTRCHETRVVAWWYRLTHPLVHGGPSQVMRAVRILRVIKVLRLVGTVRMAEDSGQGEMVDRG